MWKYGVHGIQRAERLWLRHLYICEEANRQVPPMLYVRQQSVFGASGVQEQGWFAVSKRGRGAWGELIMSEG
jgi:hypothetical protein